MAARLNARNALVVVSVAILVGTEIIAAALALGWALGGLFGLGQVVSYSLIGGCLLIGAYLVYLFLRSAARIEPIFTQDPPGRD